MFAPIRFFVPGQPASAGSKKYLHFGKSIKLVDTCARARVWRRTVQVHAAAAYPYDLIVEPVILGLEFVFIRPGMHYFKRKSGRVIRPDAPAYPDVIPDLTKLVRAIEDALTGVIWRDDSHVVAQHNLKVFGENPGAFVLIEPAGEFALPSPCGDILESTGGRPDPSAGRQCP